MKSIADTIGSNTDTTILTTLVQKECLAIKIHKTLVRLSEICVPGLTLLRRSSFKPVREPDPAPAPAGILPISSPRFTTRSFSDTTKTTTFQKFLINYINPSITNLKSVF